MLPVFLLFLSIENRYCWWHFMSVNSIKSFNHFFPPVLTLKERKRVPWRLCALHSTIQHSENVLYYRYKDSRWIPINQGACPSRFRRNRPGMVAKRQNNLIRLSTVLFLYFRAQIITKELLSPRLCETKRRVRILNNIQPATAYIKHNISKNYNAWFFNHNNLSLINIANKVLLSVFLIRQKKLQLKRA